MEFFDFGTIFFLIAAVVIFFQLRNVLGTRTGNEKPPLDPYTTQKPADAAQPQNGDDADNVISLPRKAGAEQPVKDFRSIDAVAPVGSPINDKLRAIRAMDVSFDPKTFIKGLKLAHEMIVMGYADGDRKLLKNLLSKEVYDGFVSAIDEREKRGEKQRSTYIGVEKADITAVEIKGSEAHITVSLLSQMITSTLDKQDNVIDGDPEAVIEVKDLWTFARDLKSRDPNWRLVATEAED
ncbi:Tim44/TimA family putative adaptor protein [Paenochrobactrum pullorum]|uniref:Tim44/TimA family putative adaptor protein n=1 Tax=Paenochrobactrum pullorum TaxID=1324351 RepID=UPI0035BC2D54